MKFFQKNKIALILRGVPGSGKSTFTEMMSSLYPSAAIHAVDDLHRDSDENFAWNEELSESFCSVNFANFVKSCREGIPVVVCDCINIRVMDFDHYIGAAEDLGYRVYVVTTKVPVPSEAASRNLHEVSEDQIKEMLKIWESWPIIGEKDEYS